MIKPIDPSTIDKTLNLALTEDAIEYFNKKISFRDWHKQHVKSNYHAVIISPFGRWDKDVMDAVVEAFKKLGWNCRWSDAYDGRGPHQCFYVHKSHFIEGYVDLTEEEIMKKEI